MSTRRARIKAVASLPPRRKNIDNTDKPKGAQLKDEGPKIPKSPRTPRSVAKESTDKPRPTPGLYPLQSTPSIQNKISSPAKRPETPKTNVSRTPKVAEKVSVITSASSIKSLFASPPPRTDSPCRIASPIVSKLTPRVIRPPTPLKEKPNVEVNVEGSELKGAAKNNQEKENNRAESKSDVPDDYSVPSVPESLTDEAVMDGIVPLQPTRSIPKPIDLLKNEIISENAEVNFDPIVPLPSPSKVRPKLRPVPRLAPLRRNSIQGSASESEDESRRALLGGATTPAPSRQRHDSHTSHSTLQSTNRDAYRNRNDSVCSSVSQTVAQGPAASSPVKDVKHSKETLSGRDMEEISKRTRRQEIARRMSAIRRRRETIQRDTLTMYDLIFYNPPSNPIVPDQDEIKAKEANKKEKAEREEAPSEEAADDPPAGDSAPVPQIKIGPNGEIVLDEKSLVIKQTESKRKVSSTVVREGAWGSGGGKYSRASRTAEWSTAETVRFYRAIAAIGTDFSLMAPLFPDRTRRDLKIKFKKEEKVNGAQLDKALRSATAWDATRLQEEFTQEREEAARKAELKKQQLLKEKLAERQRIAAAKEHNVRPSRGMKALENSGMPAVPSKKNTANEIIQRAMEIKAHNKRKRQIASEARLDLEVELTKAQQNTPFATITLLNKDQPQQENSGQAVDMATISRVNPREATKTPTPVPIVSLNAVSSHVPSNIESGSLVVLTVNDPKSPSKKMLQTYIAHGAGQLTPIALPPTFLNSVVGYMKKGTPKAGGSGSPQVPSPVTVQTPEGRRSATPSVIQLNPSPTKRQRHSSYTITQL